MRVTEQAIPDVLLLEPRLHVDDRGLFFEAWNEGLFRELVDGVDGFVQDNQSGSREGVLRGLHYQLDPQAQGKLVRVTQGTVFDVAVDIRRSSATFGQWVAAELSAENRRQMWIPAGFAHGFLATSAWAEVLYKTSAYYEPSLDRCIAWNDPTLAIDWPITETPRLSEKDANGPRLDKADLFD